jgi:trehalose 2-sulfotransferase
VLRPTLPAAPTAPERSCVVCSTPRAGSWLLCGLLASTGIAGRPHEWFYADTEAANRRAWDVSSFADYVARVRAAGTTPNGVFGVKVMGGYREELFSRLRGLGDAPSDAALLERHFPRPRFVWLRREDAVAQAASWAEAIRTGRWHHWDRGYATPSPRYDRGQVDALVRELSDADAAWSAWFEANGVEPYVLRFEDLVADTVGRARGVLAWLGLPSEGVRISELTVPSRGG